MSKYISLENLERYDSKMQERAASFCASKQDGMWRQTEKAGAVQFWPVGNSPLEGTVEFMFKETGSASGTKSPDNPSTISGVSSIGLTVCQEEGVDEHSYSLSLGGTYYGGSIDLATGLMTVTQEGWYAEAATTSAGIAASVIDGDFVKCLIPAGFAIKYNNAYLSSSRFATSSDSSMERVSVRGSDTFWSFLCCINKSRLDFSSAVNPSSPTPSEITSAFSAWLANNPTFVTARRTEPRTVQLTPSQIRALSQPDKYTPRLNTIYTDAEAVQIVYQKNPVRDKFEKVQAIIAQGGNV